MKKKLAVLAATAAMAATMATAAPASAQVILGSENEAESGGVDLAFEVSNAGDFASQSTPTLQFGNTGNLNNAPSFVQFDSTADDFESGGIEFSVGPTLESESSHTVRQSSAAGR
jgi:hypothetical protein